MVWFGNLGDDVRPEQDAVVNYAAGSSIADDAGTLLVHQLPRFEVDGFLDGMSNCLVSCRVLALRLVLTRLAHICCRVKVETTFYGFANGCCGTAAVDLDVQWVSAGRWYRRGR